MRRRRRGPGPRRGWTTLARLGYAALALLLLVSAGARTPPARRPPDWPALGPPTQPLARPASVLRPELACVPSPPYSNRLASLVGAELGGLEGDYGVAVYNLDTGEAFLESGDRRFPAASVYKLAVLYETWRQVKLGRLTMGTRLTITPDDAVEPEPPDGPAPGAVLTVSEALEATITISSNSAAHALLRVLGRGTVNRSMEGLGLWDTLVTAPGTRIGLVADQGVEVAATSPRDALCYLTLVARGELLGAGASAEMRRLLFRQRVNDRIPAALPPNVRVAHKTGELPGVRNDAGIVYSPRGTYVLVVLSSAVDEDEATAAIGRLSRRVYDGFTGQ